MANSVVLPVTEAATGSNCYGNAHYYFYELTDGSFPSNLFYNMSNSALTDVLDLGHGDAQQLHLVDRLGLNQLLGIGLADQKTNSQTGINAQLYIKDPITSGIRSWRELR